MARADSIIRVSIIGDAKKLTSEIKKAETGFAGFTNKLGGLGLALGGLGAGIIVTDFLKDATREGDRLGDSIQRLENQLGGELASNIKDVADDFTRLGLSTQDVTELAANFADLATSIGIADKDIASFAPSVVATAQAMALLGKGDLSTNVDLIGKAAAGSAKAAKALGVTLLEGVDPATQLTNILMQLKPALDGATTGTIDLEQQQSILQARIETLQGALGEKLNPALADVLGLLLTIASHDWGNDFARIGWGVGEILTPLARANDGLQTLIGLLHEVARLQRNVAPARSGHRDSDQDISDAQRRQQERNGLGT